MYYTLSKVGSVYRMINSELLAKHSQGNMALNIAKFIYWRIYMYRENLNFQIEINLSLRKFIT